MRKYGLIEEGFQFKWGESGVNYGHCLAYGNCREIMLSRKLLEPEPFETAREIVLHEVAHALDFVRNGGWRVRRRMRNGKKIEVQIVHDKVWKGICQEIGLKNPTRTVK